jgi:hypothetical protein
MVSIYGAMTTERKSRIWELWRKGTPMSSISRDISKPPATVFSYLLYHGGISPRTRTRRAKCLSAEERESISRGLASGASYRAIGRQLGRSASTISREVGRNGGPGKYRAYDAEKQFLKRGLRPKPYLLSSEPELRGIVIRLLEADWSPEQISGWLNRFCGGITIRYQEFPFLRGIYGPMHLGPLLDLSDNMAVMLVHSPRKQAEHARCCTRICALELRTPAYKRRRRSGRSPAGRSCHIHPSHRGCHAWPGTAPRQAGGGDHAGRAS